MAIPKQRHLFPADLPTVERRLKELDEADRQSAFERGRLLKHVKENDLTHGQWGEWLRQFGMNPNTAKRYIRVYEQFGNHATSHDLPTSKLFELIQLPKTVDRAEFLMENDIASMTVREIREAVKKEKQAAGLVKPEAKQQDESTEHEDLSVLDEVPYGTAIKILALDAESRSRMFEIAKRLSGGILADKYETILAAVKHRASTQSIIAAFTKPPDKTAVQTLGLDPYEILGVNIGEKTSVIRSKYRTLMQSVHPDKGGSEFLFKVVQEAWEAVR